jgi:nucleotide-binding universal stress UspA family protein
MTRLIPTLDFALLTVLPATPPHLEELSRRDGRVLTQLKRLREKNAAVAAKHLDAAAAILLEHGIAEGRIRRVLRPRVTGLAQEILAEAERGRHDALVIGRRGLSRAQEVFMGSVSNQLLQHATNVPLWIVDGKVTEPKVMVAWTDRVRCGRGPRGLQLGAPRGLGPFHPVARFQNYSAVD